MLMDVRTSTNLNTTRVLSLDSAGRILDWISWQDAVCLYVARRGRLDARRSVPDGARRLQSLHRHAKPVAVCIRSSPAPATAAITRSIRRRR